jgi:prepilin-type N-terminal cleavage/methylation domain-containing protein
MHNQNQIRKNRSRGFSLLEMMFAIGVLATAMIGSLAMVVLGIGRNGSNRMDTTATNVAQTVLEDIATAPPPQPPNPAPVLNIADCTGNPLAITTAVGGAPLAANGDIDFQQAAVPGYQGFYTVCSGTANGVQAPYDVRWRIDLVNGSTFAKLVTVSARQPMAINKGNVNYVPPVTLRTIVGQ